MIRRFENDDPGYIGWLAEHPDGYVLNTYMHVSSDYLVLHRARCRTVNRPLPPPRSWTTHYGKTGSDDRAELEAWALREGGRPAKPCGHCLPEEAISEPHRAARAKSTGGPHGPRGPRASDRPVAMTGPGVTIWICPMREFAPGAPPLAIEGAQWLAETFFRRDPSAVGPTSYDAWIEATQADPARRDQIVDGDVTALNSTMAARTSHETWGKVIKAADWAWLEALDPGWDLFTIDDDAWVAERVSEKLAKAFAAIRRPGLHVAVITKMLHIKRPKLIPVLDSQVVSQVGGRVSDDIGTWVAVVEHVRWNGRANLAGLRAIDEHVQAVGLPRRTLVRILDALLWTSAPGSALYSELTDWERAFRPRSGGDPCR